MKAVEPALPKELLPVREKPAIQYAIDEGIAAGITDIIIVLSPEKEQIRRYLKEPEYACELFPAKADDIASSLNRCRFSLVYQESPTGEVNAIRLAEPLIGDAPFAIIYPDDIHYPFATALPALARAFTQTGQDIIALSPVTRDSAHATGNTGRVSLSALGKNIYEITKFHPKTRDVSYQLSGASDLRTCGIMITNAHIFRFIRETRIHESAEFTDELLRRYMLKSQQFLGYSLDGRLYDIGTPAGYRFCLDDLPRA
jgi:UTP--glucose-1-phosphate uridylyltransferase